MAGFRYDTGDMPFRGRLLEIGTENANRNRTASNFASAKTAWSPLSKARHYSQAACNASAAGTGQFRFRLQFLPAANSAAFVLP